MTSPAAPTPASVAATRPGSDASAIINAVEKWSNTRVISLSHPVGGEEYGVLAVPSGMTLESVKPLLDEYAVRPDRIEGTATLQDEQSFIDHVNTFKRAPTSIFCEPSFAKPSFVAVYDYHEFFDGKEMPAFCRHRAVWALRLSKEWEAWAGQSGKWMSHADFAEFLERHAPDVFWGDERSDYTNLLIQTLELKLATTAQLVGLSRNMVVNIDTAVRSAQTLSSGEIQITYNETHKDGEGQPIKVPNAFLIAIPVIHRGPSYQILVRLRYRIQAGKVVWAFELHRSDIVFDVALDEVVERVARATERPVYRGAAEK